MKQPITLVMEFERETPGAVRYKEIQIDATPSTPDNYVVGTLYIRKRALNGAIPTQITVTLDK